MSDTPTLPNSLTPAPAHGSAAAFEHGLRDWLQGRPDARVVNCRAGVTPPQGAQVAGSFRCTLVLSGSYPLVVHTGGGGGAGSICLEPGEALTMQEGAWRQQERKATPCRILVLHFLLSHIRMSLYAFREGASSADEQEHFNLPRGLHGADAHLQKAVQEYGKEAPTPPYYPQLLRVLLERVLLCMGQNVEPAGKPDFLFEAACRYISKNFAQALSRETVADALAVHPAHLSRVFRTVGATTFHQYLQQARVQHAVHLLENPSLNQKEIAMATGFQNADHFRTVFKRVVGRSPQEYRTGLLRTLE